MKQIGFLIIIFLILQSCTTSKAISSDHSTVKTNEFVARDGTSFENAIIIEEKSETKGIAKEYEWLRVHYPGYHMIMQSLSNHNKKPFDIMKITIPEGKEIEVYFDISNFYGKF